MISQAIDSLIAYGLSKSLIAQDDVVYTRNALLSLLRTDDYAPAEVPAETELPNILSALTDYAVQEGIIEDDITLRDLFDTALMGCLTPRPSEVRRSFKEKTHKDPACATDYFYQLSKDTNYIRTDRIAKNLCWKADTEKHAAWAAELRTRYTFTPENIDEILRREVGVVFAKVLEHAGVFKRTAEGRAAFLRFAHAVR